MVGHPANGGFWAGYLALHKYKIDYGDILMIFIVIVSNAVNSISKTFPPGKNEFS